MKITILQGAFFPVPPVRGGAVEKLWHRLGLEFSRSGHHVTQISRAVPELPATSIDAGVHHLRVTGYDQPAGGLELKWRDLRYTRRALRAAPPADILVTNTFWAPLLAPARLGRIYVSVERMPKGQMRLYRRAARLRACSQAVGAAICREAPGLGAQVRVIPNPLTFEPDAPIQSRTGIANILYVGRIHPAKGVELLLRAFHQGRDRGVLPPDSRLVLVGPADSARGGGGEKWWHELLARHASPDVCWLGPIYDQDRLNTLYRSAHILAYPTLDAAGEAMPVAPLEAMAWGCVPVVSDLACFRDYIVPGHNGLIFDHSAADPVGRLLQALATGLAPEGQALAAAAAGVRQSHALPDIANRFLHDFQTLMALKPS
jgi:glycosyltransferase involved in cell wall biosynthesis